MALNIEGFVKLTPDSEFYKLLEKCPDIKPNSVEFLFDYEDDLDDEEDPKEPNLSTSHPTTSSESGAQSRDEITDVVNSLDIDAEGAGLILAKEMEKRFPILKKACDYYTRHFNSIPQSVFINEVVHFTNSGRLLDEPELLEHVLTVANKMSAYYAIREEKYKNILKKMEKIQLKE